MTVEWQSVSNGYVLRGARYEARLVLDPIPFFRFVLDGISFGELPAVSCFDQAEEKRYYPMWSSSRLTGKATA